MYLAQATQPGPAPSLEFWLLLLPSFIAGGAVILTSILSALLSYAFGLRRELAVQKHRDRLAAITKLRGLRVKLVSTWSVFTGAQAHGEALYKKHQLEPDVWGESRQAMYRQEMEARGLLTDARVGVYESLECLYNLFPEAEHLHKAIDEAWIAIATYQHKKYDMARLNQATTIAQIDQWARQTEDLICENAETYLGKPLDQVLAMARRQLKTGARSGQLPAAAGS